MIDLTKRWELRCYLEDGRCAATRIPLDIRPDLAQAIGSSMADLIKHRLYDAFIATNHLIEPNGPPLPEALKDV